MDLASELSSEGIKLPPINDVQMTEELFAYGNNLEDISDPTDNRLATIARERMKALLFPLKATEE